MKEQKEILVFNCNQAAQYVGLSLRTFMNVLVTGEIPYRKAGSRWLISKAALDNWLMCK
ncbi:MAG: helix-turn-helix domain-containing protein [Bacillota bacterium]